MIKILIVTHGPLAQALKEKLCHVLWQYVK